MGNQLNIIHPSLSFSKKWGKGGELSGFTLLELIVVVFLFGMMTLFIAPNIQDVLMDQQKKIARWIIINVRSLKETAVRDRKAYVLHIDIDRGRFWTTDASVEEDAIDAASEKGYSIPEEFRITDVAYPGKGRITAGRADIRFYEKGYSDKAVIHIEDEDNRAMSFLIEPFLPHVKYYDEYVDIED